jgi:cytochrome c biogenesis protein ResB
MNHKLQPFFAIFFAISLSPAWKHDRLAVGHDLRYEVGGWNMEDGDDAGIAARSVLVSNEKVLLWLAVGLAVVFVGLLVVDLIRRRKRERRWRRSEPKGLRARLLEPFHRAQAFKSDLERLLHERSRRHDRKPPAPPEAPP